ncbi:hypothetical protein [Vibrio parahaemolyticus]|uniref:Uncharacterized protein n=1 Tax=Vibrio parahaemolyticus TaxID=670 RepID=A0AAW3J3M1_VIBPH|nr:hypothetical protein ACX05_05670 [Vibrio parahaemolyticus]
MTKKTTSKDKVIIQHLQKQGLVKREAQETLKHLVYQLNKADVIKLNNYARHFGITAKEKLIAEILELRRDALLEKYKADKENCGA